MALLFLDSFDHYVTADLLEKYASLVGSPSISAGNGRRASASFRVTNNANHGVATPTLAVSGSTAIWGAACKVTALPSAPCALVQIRTGSTVQVSLAVNSAGQLAVYRGSPSGTLLGTSTATIPTATYVYVEFKTTLHASTGVVVVHVNELEVLTLTGVNTAASGTAWSNLTLAMQSGSVTITIDFDDVYVLDGSGAALNDFLGDCRVDARYPTAEGASTAWTPLSGTDNALMVDETAPDDDTTYNATPTIGATDTHVVQDAPVPGAVLYGVQLCLSAKKSDVGTCSIAPVVRHSGTDYPGTAINPGTTYAYTLVPYGTNPGTGAAWTEAGFNAAEFGYKRTA
jgi:hypothetical protein